MNTMEALDGSSRDSNGRCDGIRFGLDDSNFLGLRASLRTVVTSTASVGGKD
jgi:hypothetical protein